MLCDKMPPKGSRGGKRGGAGGATGGARRSTRNARGPVGLDPDLEVFFFPVLLGLGL